MGDGSVNPAARGRLACRTVDALPALIMYVDRDLSIVDCNEAVARSFGMDRASLVGCRVEGLVGSRSRMLRTMREALETGETTSGDFTFSRPDVPDIVRPMSASVVPDIDGEGVVCGLFGVATDVTPQVLALTSTARFADSLNVVLQTVVSTLDPVSMLEQVAQDVLRAMGADYALVVGQQDGRWVVSHHYGHGGDDRIGVEYDLEERPVILRAVRSGEVQLVDDALTDVNTNKGIMREFGVKSFAAVPLQYKGNPLGVFEIAFIRDKRTFDEPAVSYLRNLASAVSLTMGRLQEFQHQQRIADTLQGALLRMPDRVPGIRFDSRYLASSDEALVGGDFYDVFDMGEGRVGITIGDVSGKGLGAASITSTVRNALRLCAFEGLAPALVVSKTNELVLRDTPSEVFATLFFGVLDTETGELTYVTAAHPSAIVLHADGRPELLDGRNPIVGAFDGVRYEEESIVLCSGETLLLYTDGLTEARRADELFGETRALECVGSRRFEGLGELLDGVLTAVYEFSGHTLRDDVAMLAIELDRE
jgi:PAS domain S-box-containing protein